MTQASTSPAAPPAPAPRLLFAHRSAVTPDPDVAHDLPAYRAWVARREEVRLGQPVTPGTDTDVVLLIDRPTAHRLAHTLAALEAQTARHWKLHVAQVGDADEAALAMLQVGLAGLGPGRVVRHRAARPAGALAAALSRCDVPAVILVGQHDQLTVDAVARLSAALADADVAYADGDTVGDDGLLRTPVLKPDWSPELALTWCYPGLPLALRAGAVEAAGGIVDLDGGDIVHDLLLRVTEAGGRVSHIAEVLCHAGAVGLPVADGPGAVVRALARRHQPADVAPGPLPGTWNVRRRLLAPAEVSAIIPFRDSTRLLRTCADTLAATADAIGLELVLVDNGSVDPETLTLVEQLERRPRVTVVRDPRPFNWAALNNAAVAVAHADVLLFVNDDVEAVQTGWLEQLTAQALRPEVGAVGARLLYPDGRLQHAGVVIGLGGGAGHVLAGMPGDRPGYLGMAALARDVSAVTGACLATRREVFDRLGGFDESLGIDMNDVDYCLRARQAGWRTVYEPGATLIHHESPSRGTSGSMPDIARFVDRWEELEVAGDPFFNRNLTRTNLSPRLAVADESAHWARWRGDLERDTTRALAPGGG